MKTSIYLNYGGNCAEAFSFYENTKAKKSRY